MGNFGLRTRAHLRDEGTMCTTLKVGRGIAGPRCRPAASPAFRRRDAGRPRGNGAPRARCSGGHRLMRRPAPSAAAGFHRAVGNPPAEKAAAPRHPDWAGRQIRYACRASRPLEGDCRRNHAAARRSARSARISRYGPHWPPSRTASRAPFAPAIKIKRFSRLPGPASGFEPARVPRASATRFQPGDSAQSSDPATPMRRGQPIAPG